MHVFACTSLKGGVGKSTVAAVVASAFQEAGRSTLVVDADPQLSLVTWATRAVDAQSEVPRVEPIRSANPAAEIDRYKKVFDFLMVDTAPRRTRQLERVLEAAADVALIPTQLTALDVDETEATLAMIEELQEVRKNEGRAPLRPLVIRNRVPPTRTKLAEALDARLKGLGVPVLAGLVQRTAYAEAISTGTTVFELGQSQSTLEVEKLFEDIVSALEQPEGQVAG